MGWVKYDRNNPPKPGTLIRSALEPEKEFHCVEGSYIALGTSAFGMWEVWVEDEALPITFRSPQPAGCSCVKCQDFNNYAEPNQPDGKFICWRCRSTPFYS
jgi:hypothetical protein